VMMIVLCSSKNENTIGTYVEAIRWVSCTVVLLSLAAAQTEATCLAAATHGERMYYGG
jgi:hypothetical protein